MIYENTLQTWNGYDLCPVDDIIIEMNEGPDNSYVGGLSSRHKKHFSELENVIAIPIPNKENWKEVMLVGCNAIFGHINTKTDQLFFSGDMVIVKFGASQWSTDLRKYRSISSKLAKRRFQWVDAIQYMIDHVIVCPGSITLRTKFELDTSDMSRNQRGYLQKLLKDVGVKHTKVHYERCSESAYLNLMLR